MKNTDFKTIVTGLMTISNNGPEILDTNYWDTHYAKRGLFYLSFNAGAGRLLVPDHMQTEIPEMKTANFADVSYCYPNATKRLKILFEDHSDAPYTMLLSMGQMDRTLKASCAFPLKIYIREGFSFELNAIFAEAI